MPIGVFDSPCDLFDSIRSALAPDSQSQADSVEFVENCSSLVIKSKLHKKTVTWNIQFERLDWMSDGKTETLAKRVEELTARVKQLEQYNPEQQLTARVQQLEQHNVEQLTQRLKHMEELLGVGKQVQPLQFAVVTYPNFSLSADRTKVTKTGTETNCWQGFLSDQPISAVGNMFVVVFDKIGSKMVGVSKRNTPTKDGLYTHAGSWMLDNWEGTNYCFHNSKQGIGLGTKTQFNSGSRLTVSVSPAGLLSFELEGTLLHTFQLPDTVDLYAAIDMAEPGQSATFV